jgi:hypothetical protein
MSSRDSGEALFQAIQRTQSRSITENFVAALPEKYELWAEGLLSFRE